MWSLSNHCKIYSLCKISKVILRNFFTFRFFQGKLRSRRCCNTLQKFEVNARWNEMRWNLPHLLEYKNRICLFYWYFENVDSALKVHFKNVFVFQKYSKFWKRWFSFAGIFHYTSNSYFWIVETRCTHARFESTF